MSGKNEEYMKCVEEKEDKEYQVQPWDQRKPTVAYPMTLPALSILFN